MGVFALIFELYAMSSPKKVTIFTEGMRKLKTTDYTSEHKTYALLMLIYMLWTVAGLFTSQWVLFVFMLILSVIPKRVFWWVSIDGAISASVILFIILNKYHLHIDVLEYVKSLFGL